MDLVVPLVDEIILISEGKILEHDTKENVINGESFQTLNINKPVIYTIFNELKKKNLYKNKIPASIPEVINYFKNLN